MPLSEEKIARCQEAMAALTGIREQYADVLVVLDYVMLTDISNYQTDSADGPAGATLNDDEMAAILWHAGKHIGGMSQDILASLVEFAMDEHTRRNLPQKSDKQQD